MKISLFLIGDEIISGEREDINAHYLIKRLGEFNLTLSKLLIVGDNKEEIKNGINFLLEYSDVVITSGGLGLTPDDITVEAVADALKRKTVYDETAKKMVENSLKRMARNLKEDLESEFCKKIEGAELLENFTGVAPGEKIKIKNKNVFILPGVPREFQDTVNRYVLPALSRQNTQKEYKTEYLINARESEIVNALRRIEKIFHIKTSSYPPVLENEKYLKIKLHGKEKNVKEAQELFEKELIEKGIKIEEKISG